MTRGTGPGDAETGRLVPRPAVSHGKILPGLHALDIDENRDALLYVPASYRPDQPAPFVLSLHGAGGNEQSGLYPLHELADEFGIILLSPASRGRTWDVILGGFGPDIAFITKALTVAFDVCAIDPGRMAVAGFYDGASYALSLGITNGDLFPTVLAFSPGFAAPGRAHGGPRFFISHGLRDGVLPINQTSRRVAPMLRDAGYAVTYLEFDEVHVVPTEAAREALSWFLGDSTGSGSIAAP
jgi:predicted esterase